jgi:hypothetical protein
VVQVLYLLANRDMFRTSAFYLNIRAKNGCDFRLPSVVLEIFVVRRIVTALMAYYVLCLCCSGTSLDGVRSKKGRPPASPAWNPKVECAKYRTPPQTPIKLMNRYIRC